MTIPINSMVLGKLGVNGDRQTFGIGADGDPSPSLSTAHHHAVAYGINPQGGGMNPFDRELGETQSVCHQGGVMQVNEKPETIGFKAGQSKDGGLGDEREVSPTLSHQPSALEPTVAQSGVQCLTPNHPISHRVYHEGGAYPTFAANEGGGQNQQAIMQSLSQMRYIVRRLTPTEAERLMGLPSGWTIPTGLRRYFGADGEPSPELVDEFVERFDTFNAIMAAYEHKAPPKGKSRKQVADWLKKISCAETCPDSPRYKGCGNGQATNQPRWILTRLIAIGEGIDPFTGESHAADK